MTDHTHRLHWSMIFAGSPSAELSRPARFGYVGLLLAAATMTAIVSALLFTEPSLPLRASIALGVLAVIGLSWIAFATWVLTRKRILFGRHRVVAGRLAVTFSSVFCVGALIVAYAASSRSAAAAAMLGALMLLIATATLIRAKRNVAQLSRRREELTRQLGRRSQ